MTSTGRIRLNFTLCERLGPLDVVKGRIDSENSDYP